MDEASWNKIYTSGNVAWGNYTSTFLKDVVHLFPENCKVLDLGCGNGRNLQFLINNGYDAIGYDFSTVALSQAVVPYVKQKNLITEEWNIGTFDVVIDFGFYHFNHKDQQEIYVNKLNSVLRDGGLYINESARLVGAGLSGETPLGYKPPQLERCDFDVFDNYNIVQFKEGVLPAHGDWNEYPCWQIVLKK
tara:strand:+ start:248 stop:820 length:573 start_codon:yes stop_codon:yes gene_type:complete